MSWKATYAFMMMNANAKLLQLAHETTDENLCGRKWSGMLLCNFATGQIESYSPELFHDGQIIIDALAPARMESSLGTLTQAHWKLKACSVAKLLSCSRWSRHNALLLRNAS